MFFAFASPFAGVRPPAPQDHQHIIPRVTRSWAR